MNELRLEQIEKLKKKRKKQRRCMLLGFFICVIIGFIAFNIYKNQYFETTYYTIYSSKIDSSIRAVVIADLHCREYGEDNKELLNEIRDQKPDIILIAGDLVTYEEKDVSVAVSLCNNLVEIAPVYYCYGNHEAVLMHDSLEWERVPIDQYVIQKGLTFFYNNYVTTNINGNVISIGGFLGTPNGDGYENWAESLEEFEEQENFKLLISHFPGTFYDNVKADIDADLAVAAHYHGGLIRIPGIGGLYHPDDGLFPRYSGGKYMLENAVLIVSRGLGNHEWIPRINNQPELVIIDILGKKGREITNENGSGI